MSQNDNEIPSPNIYTTTTEDEIFIKKIRLMNNALIREIDDLKEFLPPNNSKDNPPPMLQTAKSLRSAMANFITAATKHINILGNKERENIAQSATKVVEVIMQINIGFEKNPALDANIYSASIQPIIQNITQHTEAIKVAAKSAGQDITIQ